MYRLLMTVTALLCLGIYAAELDGAPQDVPTCADSVAPLPVPDDWWTWTKDGLNRHLNCEAVIQAGRPIHTNETWVFLRQTYRQIVGGESTISPSDNGDGFEGVPIEAGVSPGKGRGLFATQDIPRGTRIWTSQQQCACFYEDHSFREFLAALPTDLACDVLMWAYAAFYEEDLLCCDLDEGSLMNTKGKDEDANVGCIEEIANKYIGGCEDNLFALRTIRAGEEILCDYDTFHSPEMLTRFGL